LAEKQEVKPKTISEYTKETVKSKPTVLRMCYTGELNAHQKNDAKRWLIFPKNVSKNDIKMHKY
jgi:hypothetical protein